MPDALTKGRPSIRPGRWRPSDAAYRVRVIERAFGKAPGESEPPFLNRLSRHLAWHLARRFLLQHPLLSAQLGLAAVKEAARFAIAEKWDRTKDRDDSP